MASLWAGIAAGDPLRAELETATCMAIPRVAGQLDPDEAEKFISTVLVDGAVRRRTPEGAALLRLLMTLGTPGHQAGGQPGAGRTDRRGYLPAGLGHRGRQGDTRPGLAPLRRVR